MPMLSSLLFCAGVGAMLVGGVFALIRMRGALAKGLAAGAAAIREVRAGGAGAAVRTERDIPLKWCAALVACSVVSFFAVMLTLFPSNWLFAFFLSAFVIVFGFFASSVAAYMAGLVGSSNNPISGVTVCVVLVTSVIMRLWLGPRPEGVVAAIYVSAMIACAGSISGDNMYASTHVACCADARR